MSPAAAIVEEIATDWVLQLLRLPSTAALGS